MANRRSLKLHDYGISRKRYNELCAFCEQYPEMKDEIKYNTDTVKSKTITDMPMAPVRTGNQTEDLVIRRVELSIKCELIENAARKANEELTEYIIANVCYEKPIWYLTDIMKMPCSERSFRDIKRYFFYLLSQNR